MPRAVALFSGGLDSMLSVRILQRQDVPWATITLRSSATRCTSTEIAPTRASTAASTCVGWPRSWVSPGRVFVRCRWDFELLNYGRHFRFHRADQDRRRSQRKRQRRVAAAGFASGRTQGGGPAGAGRFSRSGRLAGAPCDRTGAGVCRGLDATIRPAGRSVECKSLRQAIRWPPRDPKPGGRSRSIGRDATRAGGCPARFTEGKAVEATSCGARSYTHCSAERYERLSGRSRPTTSGGAIGPRR